MVNNFVNNSIALRRLVEKVYGILGKIDPSSSVSNSIVVWYSCPNPEHVSPVLSQK